MKKFNAKADSLEICSCAKFRPGYLNKQIINLLSGLGVPDEIFMVLQSEMLERLLKMFCSETWALQCLTLYSEGLLEVKAMLQSGIRIKEEPFLVQYLGAYYKRST